MEEWSLKPPVSQTDRLTFRAPETHTSEVQMPAFRFRVVSFPPLRLSRCGKGDTFHIFWLIIETEIESVLPAVSLESTLPNETLENIKLNQVLIVTLQETRKASRNMGHNFNISNHISSPASGFNASQPLVRVAWFLLHLITLPVPVPVPKQGQKQRRVRDSDAIPYSVLNDK